MANGRLQEPQRVGLTLQPGLFVAVGLVIVTIALVAVEGFQTVAQVTINGLVLGSFLALGAVGLTLVYSVLRLVNFAHGDLLTFGAYTSFLFTANFGLPLVVAALIAITLTATLGVVLEFSLWRPMRAKGAGLFELLLVTIGLAFVLRHTIQFVAGAGVRSLGIDVTATVHAFGLQVGRAQLVSTCVALVVLLGVAVMLRSTRLGKKMRALADNFALAETSGIDTRRVIAAIWLLAAALAGLAGILYAATIGVMTPTLGSSILLTLFAAMVLGGVGNAYGALAGGIMLGLAQEWSTMFIGTGWKLAVGFMILILMLIIRPQGIFGRSRGL